MSVTVVTKNERPPVTLAFVHVINAAAYGRLA